jgi:hypothetical protein
MGAFHLMAYGVTAGVNDANVDMTAVNDVIFTARNNHFIFSEPYELIAAMHMGASVLAGQDELALPQQLRQASAMARQPGRCSAVVPPHRRLPRASAETPDERGSGVRGERQPRSGDRTGDSFSLDCRAEPRLQHSARDGAPHRSGNRCRGPDRVLLVGGGQSPCRTTSSAAGTR